MRERGRERETGERERERRGVRQCNMIEKGEFIRILYAFLVVIS